MVGIRHLDRDGFRSMPKLDSGLDSTGIKVRKIVSHPVNKDRRAHLRWRNSFLFLEAKPPL